MIDDRATRRARGRLGRVVAALAVTAALVQGAAGQGWHELQGRTKSGVVPLHQALLDAAADGLVLIVASHPDDRYVLPAAYLRYRRGVRTAVLLATRGGGGQNSLGPESGDALERLRTLETEAGCWYLDADTYYLDRPDRGFRRTAAETFDEWGREDTLRELVRLVRKIRPEIVLTTHHLEETHGHDLALAELLPEAVGAAADPAFDVGLPPHRVRALFLGATATPQRPPAVIRCDEYEPLRGATLRRLAHDIILDNHLSPGAPSPMDTMFGAALAFVPEPVGDQPLPTTITDRLSSLFDAEHFPGEPARAAELRALLEDELPQLALQPAALIDRAAAAIGALAALDCPPGSEAARKRDRRVEALQRVILQAASIRIEVEPRPNAVAVPGEQLDLNVRIHVGGPRDVESIAVESDVAETAFEAITSPTPAVPAGGHLQAIVSYHVPLAGRNGRLMPARFRGDRFEPPVRLRFMLRVAGLVLPVPLVVPVDLRAPVELTVVPRMVLFPTSRQEVRFTVKVERNSVFPVNGRLDLRAPAAYRVEGERTQVDLDAVRGDIFEFTLRAAPGRKSGVDVVRIGLRDSTVDLHVHKVAVEIDPRLRVGIVRSKDDALSSVIGAGGFGIRWTELSDLDLAVGDLDEFDTIIIDVRALRGRPEARRSFRRLLDFCDSRGKRLVVLYHKDSEFQPAGESFLGAPFEPFQVGRGRVTRADAPVQVLRPSHPLLTTPNVIGPADWDEWGQERGLYFPNVYAPRYVELLEMNDPGLPPERSALLYARTEGGGEYVYCALALWRQWKKLHPGSVRILANLLTPHVAAD